MTADRFYREADAWDLELFVPGRAAPQGSKRGIAIARGRGPSKVYTGKVAQMEMSPHVKTWRNDVRGACLEAWAGRAPLDGPIEFEVEFIRKRPAGAPKSYTPDASTQPDLSKLVRSTEDAITSAGVWADDGRVVRTVSSKRCADIGETPGAWIRIRLRPTARELATAGKRPQIVSNGSNTPPGRTPTSDPPSVSDAHSQPPHLADSGVSQPLPTVEASRNPSEARQGATK